MKRLNMKNPRLLLSRINLKKPHSSTKNSFYSSNSKIDLSQSYFSITTKDYINSDRLKSLNSYDSINRNIDNFMSKKVKKKIVNDDKNDNDILKLFSYLPSTNHTLYKNRNKPILLTEIKERFTGTKIESFTSLHNRVKRNIEKSILNRYLTNSNENKNPSVKNYYSMENDNIENTLNKKYRRYNKDNFQEIHLHPHQSKRSEIGSILPPVCFPVIIKDTGLMARLYKQNFNYQKNILRNQLKE
jgi:hypothetical protein